MNQLTIEQIKELSFRTDLIDFGKLEPAVNEYSVHYQYYKDYCLELESGDFYTTVNLHVDIYSNRTDVFIDFDEDIYLGDDTIVEVEPKELKFLTNLVCKHIESLF